MFIQQKKGDFYDDYKIHQILGTGAYGEVSVCTHKLTQQKRAVKIQHKGTMSEQERNETSEEIKILKGLDHPNIVKIYEYYEDENWIYIVQDLVRGGQLFDEIATRGRFNERDAAVVIKQVLRAINYCHQRNVCHRDLKPENIMMEDKENLDQIKVVDFGSAKWMFSDQKFNEKHGTAYYVAPEVLKESYGKECDIWSLGVISFLMLSGICPFRGQDNEAILKKVEKGRYNFQHKGWDKVSLTAQQFVDRLLTYNPDKRISAADALQHPWITNLAQIEVDETFASAALGNLMNFHASSLLITATLSYIGSQLLSKDEREDLAKVFTMMDANGDGHLTKEELRQGYQQGTGRQVSDAEIERLFRQIDMEETGYISFSEFLVACSQTQEMVDDKKLQMAFKIFDQDGSGKITIEELKDILCQEQNGLPDEVVEKIMSQADQNGDGTISLDEFISFIRNCK